MAKYDHGGGCACGLQKECDCSASNPTETNTYTLEGWVIVPPLSPWDVKHKDKIWPHSSYGTFGQTSAEAWRRHIGRPDDPQLREAGEVSRRIQLWHDGGYRAKRARLEIIDESL